MSTDIYWKGNKLYKGTKRTGYSVRKTIAGFGEHSMYRVIYPDGKASKDYYNKTMAKEHCRNEYFDRKMEKREPDDEPDRCAWLGPH